MRALVFGANGQDGVYLCELLGQRGVESVGVSRSSANRAADVGCLADVESLVREILPDYVFHLAANSTTQHDALFENHVTIATGTLNILECVRRHCPDARVFIAGSGLQFANTGAAIDEACPFEAASPYAASRIAAVHAARYFRRLGVRAYVGYLFNHESPLREPQYVSRLIADAARRIAGGSGEVLEIGDPGVVKEWTFAGDVARAMLTLVMQEELFEVVIGSGKGHSVEEWLEACFSRVDLSWRDHTRVRADYDAGYASLVSSPKLLRKLGWRPRVGFDDLADMMMSGRL
jgi:GDPmannose 4,6-dehydratase